jgi:tetratricopeptide (TPR) repeat protein
MKYYLMITAAAILLFGCGEKKVDAEKLNHANALVNTGDFEEGIMQLEDLYKSTPDDIALKQSLISAHMKYGNYFMYNDTLAPRIKYPNALKHYKAVLRIDASNTDAKDKANQIIEIYQMMGRPVPEV